MNYNVTLNLDEYLENFKTFTSCKEILDNYYLKYSKVDDEYAQLLRDRYPLIYRLLMVVSPKYSFNYEEWYYIADNTYKLKGSIESLNYILSYLNITVKEYNYDLMDLSIKISLVLSSNEGKLIQIYINDLVYDLLLVANLESDYSQIQILYELDGEVYHYSNSTHCNDQNVSIKKVLLNGNLGVSSSELIYQYEL